MTALFKMELLKSSKDKGLYFWTFILPILFTIGFIAIFTSGSMAENKEEIILSIIPGYAVMFVFFIMISMCLSFLSDSEKGMIARIASTSISPLRYLTGKWVAYMVIVLIQIIFMFIFGKIVYTIPISQPIYLLILSIILSFAVTAMGVMLSVFVQSENMGIAITQVIALGGAILGGLWFPHDMLPAFIQKIGKFTPQYWAHQAYQKALAGSMNFAEFLSTAGILLAFGIICMLAAYLLYPSFLERAKN